MHAWPQVAFPPQTPGRATPAPYLGSPRRAAQAAGTGTSPSHVTRELPPLASSGVQPARPALTHDPCAFVYIFQNGACIPRVSPTFGRWSRFETQGCAADCYADRTADSPELWRGATFAAIATGNYGSFLSLMWEWSPT